MAEPAQALEDLQDVHRMAAATEHRRPGEVLDGDQTGHTTTIRS